LNKYYGNNGEIRKRYLGMLERSAKIDQRLSNDIYDCLFNTSS